MNVVQVKIQIKIVVEEYVLMDTQDLKVIGCKQNHRILLSL
ncbi:hypothetical protein BACINT_03324 [Bacteroides intestinalis DSM 17393]|uniref:Uncharacterized protein n=1 Tax=Bacteroides intestinalis DSM 17393 TaxID=471870 RepID=B3CAT9_9BACE|nr:hypothetical protein BACINT_03324 [Bacteroides intestinalis DSM 17393]